MLHVGCMTIVTKPVNCTTHVGQKHMQPCGKPQYIGESKHVVNYIIIWCNCGVCKFGNCVSYHGCVIVHCCIRYICINLLFNNYNISCFSFRTTEQWNRIIHVYHLNINMMSTYIINLFVQNYSVCQCA